MNWLKQHYGSAEGPLGFPMTDKQAFALEAIIKSLPEDNAYAYRKVIVGEAGPPTWPSLWSRRIFCAARASDFCRLRFTFPMPKRKTSAPATERPAAAATST